MKFEIMEAACRPGPGSAVLSPASQATFSVGIRPVVAKGRKKAAWVRVVGPVLEEKLVDSHAGFVAQVLSGKGCDQGGLFVPGLPPIPCGLAYSITAAGKRGGLRRAT